MRERYIFFSTTLKFMQQSHMLDNCAWTHIVIRIHGRCPQLSTETISTQFFFWILRHVSICIHPHSRVSRLLHRNRPCYFFYNVTSQINSLQLTQSKHGSDRAWTCHYVRIAAVHNTVTVGFWTGTTILAVMRVSYHCRFLQTSSVLQLHCWFFTQPTEFSSTNTASS